MYQVTGTTTDNANDGIVAYACATPAEDSGAASLLAYVIETYGADATVGQQAAWATDAETAITEGTTCAADAFACYWEGDTCYQVTEADADPEYQCLGASAIAALTEGTGVEWNADAAAAAAEEEEVTEEEETEEEDSAAKVTMTLAAAAAAAALF